MYNDHILYLMNEMSDKLNYDIILKLSNKNTPLKHSQVLSIKLHLDFSP